MYYLDTSAFAPLFIEEARSEVIEAFVNHHPDLAVSVWGEVEFESILARKRREGVDAESVAVARAAFAAVRTSHIPVTLPVTDVTFRRASALLREGDTPLRSADALHLAIAALHDVTLVTADRRLADAAEHHGVAVHRIP